MNKLEKLILKEIERVAKGIRENPLFNLDEISIEIVNLPEVHAMMMQIIDDTYYHEERAYEAKGSEFEGFYEIMEEETFFGVVAHIEGKPLAYIIGSEDLEDIPEDLQEKSYYVNSQAHNSRILTEEQGLVLRKYLNSIFTNVVSALGYSRINLHTDDDLTAQVFSEMEFEEVQLVPDYYEPGDALLMTKSLAKTRHKFSQADLRVVRPIFNPKIAAGASFVYLVHNTLFPFSEVNSFRQVGRKSNWFDEYIEKVYETVTLHMAKIIHQEDEIIQKLIGEQLKYSLFLQGGKRT